MDKDTWEQLLIERAAAIADARVSRNKDRDSRLKTPKYADTKWVNPKTYFGEALEFLKKEYPYEKITDEGIGDLLDTKDIDVVKWIWERGPSPKEIKGDIEAAKFLELLNGVAPEGQDWYTMGTEALKGKAIDMGWKVNTPERFNAFLKQLGEYQQQYDRAKNVDELKNAPFMTLFSLAYPSAYKEAERAVATGEGGDVSTISNLMAMDALVNGGMVMAPNMKVSSTVPILNSVLGAGTQAGLEAARQGYANFETDGAVDFDPNAVTFAGAAGATTPALVGLLRGGAARIPGESAAKFNRGVTKSVRTTDPVEAERRAWAKKVEEFNKSQFSKIRNNDDPIQIISSGESPLNGTYTKYPDGSSHLFAPLSPAEFETERQVSLVPENLKKVFKIQPDANGKIEARYVLENYDNPVMVYTDVSNTGVKPVSPVDISNMTERERAMWNLTAPQTPSLKGYTVLDNGTYDTYRTMFPARYQEMVDNKPGANWFKVGRGAGALAQDLGGSIEPTFKVGSSKAGVISDDYKKSDWYIRLGKTKEGKEKQKLVDEAFERMRAKREGQE